MPASRPTGEPAVVEPRGALARRERTVRLVRLLGEVARERAHAARRDRARTGRRSSRGSTATSGTRRCSSRAAPRRRGSTPTDCAPSTRIGRPVRLLQLVQGSTWPVVQRTCESAIRRVRGPTSARIASASGAATTTIRSRRDSERPEQAEVLRVGGDDLVARREVEAVDDDVAAVGRRARQREPIGGLLRSRPRARPARGPHREDALEEGRSAAALLEVAPCSSAATASKAARASGPAEPAFR